MLFESEYSFRGSHGMKVRKLTAQFDENGSAKLFNRNIDVYIVAPLIGFLYGRKAERDKSGEDSTKIFHQQLFTEQALLKYNYQLIMLLDEKNEPSFEERLNKAFRYYGDNSEKTLADEQLYEQYVLGGVDILYEKLIEEGTSDDYVLNLYDFLEEFNERYNDAVSNDKILDLCALARS